MNTDILVKDISRGDHRAIARALSLVENGATEYEAILKSLHARDVPLIGITGPPGAGKSTLVDQLIGQFRNAGERVAALCVDPSSPFSRGALLGDRLRMNRWFEDPAVFIRSVASRGALGGLHAAIVEVTEVLKSAPFDRIVVETVGVGQSDIEIARLSDITVVVLVPESGDDIQMMKAGLLEIADIFVVNKSDRPDADKLVGNLQSIREYIRDKKIPVFKTIATQSIGIEQLATAITQNPPADGSKKTRLMAARAYQLIMQKKMTGIRSKELEENIGQAMHRGNFNLYRFVEEFEP